MHDPTSTLSDPGSCPCGPEVARLRAEVDALRGQIAEGVRTRRLTVVGPDGHERIRLDAHDDHGHVIVASRPAADGGEATRVDLFALDAEDGDDRPYVGLELVDRGDSVAGLALYEGRPPRHWTHPDT